MPPPIAPATPGQAPSGAPGPGDGDWLRHNDAKLQERIGEIAKKSADLAEIYDGWVLADMAKFARASLADFFKRDDKGRIELKNGLPVLDFSLTSEEQY